MPLIGSVCVDMCAFTMCKHARAASADQHQLQAAIVRYASERAGLSFKPEVHIKGDKWCRQSALNNSDRSFTFKHDHRLPCYRQYMARLNLGIDQKYDTCTVGAHAPALCR